MTDAPRLTDQRLAQLAKIYDDFGTSVMVIGTEFLALLREVQERRAQQSEGAQAERGREEWKPIESAPDTGRVIVFDGCWGVCEAIRFDNGEWGLGTFNGQVLKATPLMWRPLPEPPSGERATAIALKRSGQESGEK